MIRIDNLQVYGIESAMRGMRNPMNSWHKNDTVGNEIGPNDLDLLLRLTKAGTDHRKVLRQIMVSCGITAPLYWWKQFDQHKVGVTSNSCSTMYKLCSRPLTIHDFSFEDMHDDEFIVNLVIDNLNARIKDYNDGMKKNKALWRTIIQLLPNAYNQMRTITMSYENVLRMYEARRYEKLGEWHDFNNYMIDNLPYLKELISGIQDK